MLTKTLTMVHFRWRWLLAFGCVHPLQLHMAALFVAKENNGMVRVSQCHLKYATCAKNYRFRIFYQRFIGNWGYSYYSAYSRYVHLVTWQGARCERRARVRWPDVRILSRHCTRVVTLTTSRNRYGQFLSVFQFASFNSPKAPPVGESPTDKSQTR